MGSDKFRKKWAIDLLIRIVTIICAVFFAIKLLNGDFNP